MALCLFLLPMKKGVKNTLHPPSSLPFCFYVQVRSGRRSEPDVLKLHPPLFSTERTDFLQKENAKCLQDVCQLLFIKRHEITPVCIYSFLDFLHLCVRRGRKETIKSYFCFMIINVLKSLKHRSVSSHTLFLAQKKKTSLQTETSFTVSRFIVYSCASMGISPVEPF